MATEEPDRRICGRCQRELSIDEFNWRRKARGQRDNMCRSCRAAYHHEHYEANRGYLLEHFKTHPCSDCGEADPVVLEFDHVGPKLFNIASDLVDRSWPSILAEIEQCEVVCANCHRRRTVERRGGLRFVMSRASEESA